MEIPGHVTNPESMWMFGLEGGTSLFYQGVLQLGTGVKVTARRLSLPFPWREAGYFPAWGNRELSLQSQPGQLGHGSPQVTGDHSPTVIPGPRH